MKNIFLLFAFAANFCIAQTPLTTSVSAVWHLNGNGAEPISSASVVITNSVSYGANGGKIGTGATTQYSTSVSQLLVNQNNAFVFGSGDFTVNAWVKKVGQSRTQYFWGQSDAGGNNSSISFLASFDATNHVSCYWALPGVAKVVTSTVATTDTNWHMVTQVRIGASGFLYFDGIQVASLSTLSNTALVSVNESFGMLCGGNLGTSFHDNLYGSIDELTIWKGRGLVSAEILTLYRNGAGFAYPFLLPNLFFNSE